ncbi:hypothetical protein GT037_004304 [Alternaria burnsii]|uniref:Uncharacterized protein n=1 Tax=Alternaria burnsii TaxID=1187904 RepID=A0A8H7B6N0_9PLEO|nr:uncharacterized protein GT037_004304 [Alternaria burnsii]KAF7677445.1 hypothetical protein GT037_004304 [Alternaria burnsii]CAI9627276.1 unnamed protein product [Alternaria burnsii]
MEPPPVIFITDYTTLPPTATRYICGNNDIAFPTAYTQIKSLISHPACPHRNRSYSWSCHSCESTFTTKYWSCAAILLDYFADFYPKDTPLMQSIWFQLLDIWQESASRLPYEAVLEASEAAAAIGAELLGANHARTFEKSVRDTISLFEVTIWGRRESTGDQVIYDPRGEAWCPVGEYETGPWVSGLKPWAQFLGDGGVGVAPPFCGRVGVANEEEDDGNGTRGVSKQRTTTRYIPLPALGVINSHTERARKLAVQLFNKQDPDLLTTSLAELDAHTLPMPASRNKSHSYISKITGLETSYTLSNGAPPVIRYEGLGDPQMELKGVTDWNLLDECVASCRGVEAYVPVSGGSGNDDMEDDDGEDEADGFDMWTLIERGTSGEGGKALDLGDMFDTWCAVDEI